MTTPGTAENGVVPFFVDHCAIALSQPLRTARMARFPLRSSMEKISRR